MINPIKSSPLAVPADLANVSLPVSMTRATAVPPPEQMHKPGTATTQEPDTHQNTDGDTALEKTLEQLNDSMQAWSTGMRFDVDEDAQRIVVSIVDSATGEVLRTVPSDAVIRVAKMIVQLQGGSIDTRA